MFLYLHGHKLANLEHELQKHFLATRLIYLICSLTPVPDFSTVKLMKFICNLFEPRYKILTLCEELDQKQIKEVFFRCEDCACMLYLISLHAQISQNVKYWYEICDVLVPIFHAL